MPQAKSPPAMCTMTSSRFSRLGASPGLHCARGRASSSGSSCQTHYYFTVAWCSPYS